MATARPRLPRPRSQLQEATGRRVWPSVPEGERQLLPRRSDVREDVPQSEEHTDCQRPTLRLRTSPLEPSRADLNPRTVGKAQPTRSHSLAGLGRVFAIGGLLLGHFQLNLRSQSSVPVEVPPIV